MAIDVRNQVGDDNHQILPPSFHHHLLRPSESIIYLCSIPSSTSIDSSTSSPSSTDKNAILQSGLDILEPLKSQCLFRTIDWFTYSFCHGTEVRQFRALPGTNGPHGTPAADPTQESYILGRFTPNSEKIYPDRDGKSNGGDKNHLVSSQSHTTTATLGSTSSSDTNVGKEKSKEQTEGGEEEDGAELVEVLRFSSSGDQDDLAERYLSQKWGGGTRCDITMEPRETEVQFHCNPKIPHAKISFIKETTTCAYVLIIETPKLCTNPAFSVGKEEKVSEIACRAIVPDGWKKGEGEIASEKWSGKDANANQVPESQSHSNSAEASSQTQETSTPNQDQASDSTRDEEAASQSSSSETLSQDDPNSHESSEEDPLIDISEKMYVIALDEDGNYVVESVDDDGGAIGDSLLSSLEGLGYEVEGGLDDVMELVLDPQDLLGVLERQGGVGQGAQNGGNGNGREGRRRDGADGGLGRGFSDQLADILERNLNERNGGGQNHEQNEARRRELQEQLKKWNNVLEKVSGFTNPQKKDDDDSTSKEEQKAKNKERYEKLSQQAKEKYNARKNPFLQDQGESPEALAHRAANQKLKPPQVTNHQQQQMLRNANAARQQTPLQPKSMKKETESFAEKVGRMYREKDEKERKAKEQQENRRKVEL